MFVTKWTWNRDLGVKIGPSGSKLRYAGYAFLSKYVFYGV